MSYVDGGHVSLQPALSLTVRRVPHLRSASSRLPVVTPLELERTWTRRFDLAPQRFKFAATTGTHDSRVGIVQRVLR